MNKTVVIPITCSCKDQKKFNYTAVLSERSHSADPISVQIDCPFRLEPNCARFLTIQLPPGVQLEEDDNMLREG